MTDAVSTIKKLHGKMMGGTEDWNDMKKALEQASALQQHADQLAEALREVLNIYQNNWYHGEEKLEPTISAALTNYETFKKQP